MPAASLNGIQLNIGTGPMTKTESGAFNIGVTIEILVPLSEALSRYKITL